METEDGGIEQVQVCILGGRLCVLYSVKIQFQVRFQRYIRNALNAFLHLVIKPMLYFKYENCNILVLGDTLTPLKGIASHKISFDIGLYHH